MNRYLPCRMVTSRQRVYLVTLESARPCPTPSAWPSGTRRRCCARPAGCPSRSSNAWLSGAYQVRNCQVKTSLPAVRQRGDSDASAGVFCATASVPPLTTGTDAVSCGERRSALLGEHDPQVLQAALRVLRRRRAPRRTRAGWVRSAVRRHRRTGGEHRHAAARMSKSAGVIVFCSLSSHDPARRTRPCPAPRGLRLGVLTALGAGHEVALRRPAPRSPCGGLHDRRLLPGVRLQVVDLLDEVEAALPWRRRGCRSFMYSAAYVPP